jgi:mono/diheme cytochrome c family protein
MRFGIAVAVLAAAWLGLAQAKADEISPERGRIVSIVGGCHDCHTAGYSQADGVIDPSLALKGNTVGWQGPWGTTYALNLRLTAQALSEDGFVAHLAGLRALPPMPWYNLRAMPESDLRSLYRYIKSLGDPGEQAPVALPPGEKPKTPFVVLSPPQMPPPCTRDLDCGRGEICSTDTVRQCIVKE